MPISPSLPLANLSRRYIATAERIPPERLIIPAVKPRVTNAKHPFATAIISAEGKPRLPAANMVIIFEKPGFAPGGSQGIGGRRLSRKPSANAKAHIIPVSAVLYAIFFFIG